MYEEILEKVVAYFTEEIDDPEIEITPDSDLMDDLELSSLEMLKALVYLEVEWDLTIPEKYLKKIFTIKDVAKVIFGILEKMKLGNADEM